MTKKDLIEALKDVPDDLEVTVWADHGQCDFKAEYVTISYISKDEFKNYMMEGTHVDDIENEEDYVKVCQIS